MRYHEVVTAKADGSMIRAILFLGLTVIFCLSVAGSAFGQSRQMYSWTDENGVVHFTDSRPDGQEVTLHDIPDSEPQADTDLQEQPETDDEISPGQQRREEITQQRQEAQAEADENVVECAASRALVERLEPNRRVFLVNEEGETVRMDDVERTDQVAQAKAFIEENCKERQ
jgi:hypothetical protein